MASTPVETYRREAEADKAGPGTYAPETARLVRSVERGAVFLNLGRQLSSVRTFKEAARSVVEAADALFGWDACLFSLCPGDPSKFETILAIETVNGRRVDVDPDRDPEAPVTLEALRTGPKLTLRSGVQAGSTGNARASLSEMTVPILNQGAVIGAVTVQSCSAKAYTEDDLQSLTGLAEHCAGALERIRAEQEISRLNVELERRVQARTLQLEATNRELEAFCYSVSHDLRAPLRSIRGFSEVLLERYAGELDQKGQEFLRRVCESCGHMDRLIDDLLKLSRVSRSELQFSRIDLSSMAREIGMELAHAERDRKVEFVIEPGLVVEGDERLLRVALENLLRNAWKFTRDQPHPVVEFRRVPGPENAFCVKDNGAGFDMAFASKLFGVFQRLHTASEFPGTGIGLATVQRIINRHGGRTWAEGAVNQGATFYFVLPRDTDS